MNDFILFHRADNGKSILLARSTILAVERVEVTSETMLMLDKSRCGALDVGVKESFDDVCRLLAGDADEEEWTLGRQNPIGLRPVGR